MNRVNLIQQIVAIEWSQFSQVQNVNGPADCQNNLPAFCAIRTIQASIWQDNTLKSYLNDLQIANDSGRNLMTEKYAQMMATTHPEEYQCIKDYLAVITAEKQQVLEQIMMIFTRWENDAMSSIINNNIASFQPEIALVYLHNELSTYSMKTLALCLYDAHEAFKIERNFVREIFEKTLTYYRSLGITNVTNLQKVAIPCNNSQPLKIADCGSCGIDVPIDNSASLGRVANELLNYDLPAFYDAER